MKVFNGYMCVSTYNLSLSTFNSVWLQYSKLQNFKSNIFPADSKFKLGPSFNKFVGFLIEIVNYIF